MKEFGRMKRILFATSLLVGATLCGGNSTATVSYTHLTLPTICSV